MQVLKRSGIAVKTDYGVIRFEPLPTTSSFEYEHRKFTEVQKKRRRQVESVCEKHNLNNKEFEEVFLSLVADIDDKFVFCNNYKVRNIVLNNRSERSLNNSDFFENVSECGNS